MPEAVGWNHGREAPCRYSVASVGRAHLFRAGRSSRSIRPCRFHPTDASHVRGDTTGDAYASGGDSRNPVNHAAEEHRVEPGHRRKMLPPILKDVDEGGPHFPRRRDRSCVVAVGPYAAVASEDAVHGAREANGEPLQAPRQRVTVRGLDQKVDMIRLDGERDDPETLPRRPREGAAYRREDSQAPATRTASVAREGSRGRDGATCGQGACGAPHRRRGPKASGRRRDGDHPKCGVEARAVRGAPS